MNKMNRREQALEHHTQVLQKDHSDIHRSILMSESYDDSIILDPFVKIKHTDCLSAAIEANAPNYTITILNFASFLHPGGGYLQGAMAQEESLCSESNLYEILSNEHFDEYYKYNQKHKNKGLYENRAIFTYDVKFTRNDIDYYFNVLTCAAPNYRSAIDHGCLDETIHTEYINRLQFIYRILQKNDQDLFIAGLWGCGVFGFPKEAALSYFEQVASVNTILAIPTDPKFQNKRSI